MDVNLVKNQFLDTYSKSTFLINGDWVKSNSREVIKLISPSTEEIIGAVPDANEIDVDRAVRSAKAAFEDKAGWRTWPVARRVEVMKKLADILEARHLELSLLYAHELGRPFQYTYARPSRPAELLRYYASLGEELTFDEIRPIPKLQNPGMVKRTSVKLESRGVTAVIVPYNGTLEMGLFKMGPTLLLGGTIVLKPSPQSPLEAYIFAESALQAGIPSGVVNVLPGSKIAGESLVAHPDVDIVGFTGSTNTGRAIAQICAKTFKSTVLELGGKSAAILLSDADVESFAKALPYLGFTFSGQNCFIHSRIVVSGECYDQAVEAIVQASKSIKVGDPFDASTNNGPLISQAHRNRIQEFIESGKSEGANLIYGGDVPANLQTGWYLNPTVFIDASSDMRICREEIFGPVLSVLRVDSDEEAIQIANDSEFGLAGSVWSQDESHARFVADQIDTGSIGINGFGFNTAAPFGGRRNSGIGTELGIEGLLEYAKYKSTHYTS
jgi:acyl-CoA reductase-like NAD-dependent aldehyde dehydrogenase